MLVVDVEVRTGDEPQPRVAGDLDRAQVVGLDHASGVGDQAAQGLEIAFGFEQGLRREHDFLAGIAQIPGQADPVCRAQLLAARTDRLADVNAVDRRMLRSLGIELHDLGFRPEEQQRSQGNLHQRHGLL